MALTWQVYCRGGHHPHDRSHQSLERGGAPHGYQGWGRQAGGRNGCHRQRSSRGHQSSRQARQGCGSSSGCGGYGGGRWAWRRRGRGLQGRGQAISGGLAHHNLHHARAVHHGGGHCSGGNQDSRVRKASQAPLSYPDTEPRCLGSQPQPHTRPLVPKPSQRNQV